MVNILHSGSSSPGSTIDLATALYSRHSKTINSQGLSTYVYKMGTGTLFVPHDTNLRGGLRRTSIMAWESKNILSYLMQRPDGSLDINIDSIRKLPLPTQVTVYI